MQKQILRLGRSMPHPNRKGFTLLLASLYKHKKKVITLPKDTRLFEFHHFDIPFRALNRNHIAPTPSEPPSPLQF